MARRQPAASSSDSTTSTKESNLSFAPVEVKAANDTLRQNRSGRASGRTSMFAPILEATKELPEGEVLQVKGVGKTQVMGLRNYVFKHLDKETWTVKSVREKGADTFICLLGRKVDFGTK